jgi:sulfatase maturation enzyme AslB (radical SAM superfamily)
MGNDKISDVWNSEYYKEVRMKMIRGEKVNHCEICYKVESTGSESRRELNNRVWKERLGINKVNEIKRNVEAGFGLNLLRPLSFDLRLGNVCNLKCRMCNSMTSTSFAGEWDKLRKQNLDLTAYKSVDSLHTMSKKLSNWFQDDEFWDDIDGELETIERIYLTGGEPTLIKRNNEFLVKLIEKKRFNVEVVLNTNITMLNDDLLSNLEKFNKVSLSMSIDGVGEVNDYIRYPSIWSEIESNIKKIFKRKINIDITYTLSVYNFFDLKNFIKWYLDHGIGRVNYIDWNILDEPEFLSVSVIPHEIRVNYLEELSHYLDSIRNNDNHSIVDSLKNTFGLLLAEDTNKKFMKTFLNYTKMHDKSRNCSLLETVKEFDFIRGEYLSL